MFDDEDEYSSDIEDDESDYYNDDAPRTCMPTPFQTAVAVGDVANTACGPYSCVPALISRGAGGVTRNTTRDGIFSNAATFARMRHPLSP